MRELELSGFGWEWRGAVLAYSSAMLHGGAL